VAIDDLHWANHTTRELAERLLDLTDRSAFILATALRPDPGSEAWTFRLRAQAEYPHRTEEVALAPLTPDAARALIDAFVPPGLLGDAVRDELVVKAEGNPLFVEELVRALLQSGGDRRRTWTITPGAAADLPPALEALLVSRIDRLDPGPRRLAQVAAVVGREFPVSVATAVAESDDPVGDVAALLRAEIVRELRRFPELECTFRHGLVQEAALSTLTPTALREMYGRVGHAMEDRFADQIDERLEQLAFYFYRSEEPEIALGYLERAAARAAGLEAFDRATSLWTRARRLAGRLEDEEAATRADERLAELASRAAGSSA
jgi:predicted ATPase